MVLFLQNWSKVILFFLLFSFLNFFLIPVSFSFFSKNSFFMKHICFNEFWLRTRWLKILFYVLILGLHDRVYKGWSPEIIQVANPSLGGNWFMSISHHVWYILSSTTIVLEENGFERKRKQHSPGKGACPEAQSVYIKTFQK